MEAFLEAQPDTSAELIDFVEHLRHVPDPWRAELVAEFLGMEDSTQARIVAVFTDMAGAEPGMELGFVQRMQMPDGVYELVLEEAALNGADPEWDLPAFEEALTDLRTRGDTGEETLQDLARDFAPLSIALVPAWRALVSSEERLRQSGERLRRSEEELRQSEERLKAIRAAVAAADRVIESLEGLPVD